MRGPRGTAAFAVLLMALGTGWLLCALGYAPEINWVWVFALATIGLGIFVVSGLDKVSVVAGPFFLAAGALAMLRQAGHLAFEVEIPIFVILGGGLLLIASRPAVPAPKWFIPEKPAR